MESAYVSYKVAKVLAADHGCKDMNVAKEHSVLLKTGAKLCFAPMQRRWYVSGYSWNGKDVDDIVKEYVR